MRPFIVFWYCCWLLILCPLTIARGESPTDSEATNSPDALRVMSFNVRVDFDLGVPSDQPTAWISTGEDHRRDRTIKTIRDFDPDLLGLQEPLVHQVNAITKALPDLGHYGVGRDDGRQAGEYCMLLYRKTRFEQREAGTLWLSETPETVGSQHPDAACVRIASWLELSDRRLKQTLLVVNTHWDHVSQPARQQGAEVIRRFLEKQTANQAVIVMGDFNAREDASELIALRGDNSPKAVRLIDSYRTLHPSRDANEVTYQGFTSRTEGQRIDFILHNASLKPLSASIVRWPVEVFPASDHYPVTAVLTPSK